MKSNAGCNETKSNCRMCPVVAKVRKKGETEAKKKMEQW